VVIVRHRRGVASNSERTAVRLGRIWCVIGWLKSDSGFPGIASGTSAVAAVGAAPRYADRWQDHRLQRGTRPFPPDIGTSGPRAEDGDDGRRRGVQFSIRVKAARSIQFLRPCPGTGLKARAVLKGRRGWPRVVPGLKHSWPVPSRESSRRSNGATGAAEQAAQMFLGSWNVGIRRRPNRVGMTRQCDVLSSPLHVPTD